MKNLSPPLISVIVPIYNVEKYLPKCIESIMAQDYTNLEIILINDGSEDSCPEIADYYANLDTRVKVFHSVNQGLSVARNIGLDISNGSFIGLVDSDDWIEKDMYSSLYSALKENDADAAICGFRQAKIDETFINNTVKKINCCNATTVISGRQNILEFLIKNHNTPPPCTILYEKSLFENIRYPKGKIHEDSFVTYLLFDKAKKIVVNSMPKYNYLCRLDSISRSPSIKWFDLVEGRIQQYKYISSNYPDLAYYAVRNVCLDFVWIFKRLAENGKLKECREKIDILANEIRKIPYYDSNLSQEDAHLLKLLLSNMRQIMISTLLKSKN